MSSGYLTVKDTAQAEITVNKSRFIAVVQPIKDWEQATAVLEDLRKKYWDSTHICYGCVADEFSNVMRFSDDGEPQGTAGKPILEIIKQKKLKYVLLAVIRYFGGIKLGVGGLVRAYSKAAIEVINASDIMEIRPKKSLTINISYSDYKKIENFFNSDYIETVQKEWGEKIHIILNVDIDYYQTLLDNLQNVLGINLTI